MLPSVTLYIFQSMTLICGSLGSSADQKKKIINAVSIKVLEQLFNVIKCPWARERKHSQGHSRGQRRDF